MIITFLAIRRIIGILGMALPVVVVVGGFIGKGFIIQDSISSYYYTNMRDFFVGTMCVVAVYLIAYRGYERIDGVVTDMSGVFALGVVAFPTSTQMISAIDVGIFHLSDKVSQYFHVIFAALFFLSLAFISIFLFTRSGGTNVGREKRRRNAIYRICGCVMVFAIAVMIIFYAFLRETGIAKTDPILFLETVALISFGISWFVKGDTLFRDKKS